MFLILIAVALFAALSYAVTSSSKGGGSGITKDKAKLHAAEIIQYATQMEQTVSRLRVINQCSDTQISFDGTTMTGYVNPNAPSDKRCHVFDAAAGGAMALKKPGTHLNDESEFYYTARTCVVNVGSGKVGCYTNNDYSDLVMYLPRVYEEICVEINNKLGIINPAGTPPNGDNTEVGANAKFVGAYNNNNLAETGGGGEAANYNGKYSGCFLYSGTYYYYHVLVAR